MHVTPLRHRLNGVLSVVVVILMKSAWNYWSGNMGLETGVGIVGIPTSTTPLAPSCCCMACSWQAHLYAKCHWQTRLNNSYVWERCWALVLAYLAPRSHRHKSVCVLFVLCATNEVCVSVSLLWKLIIWKAFLMHDSSSLFWLLSQVICICFQPATHSNTYTIDTLTFYIQYVSVV